MKLLVFLRTMLLAASALLPPMTVVAAAVPSVAPIRAAYFYDYMPLSHLDSLAAVGMNRAVIKWIADSLGARGTAKLRSFMGRGASLGVEIAPCFAFNAPTRLRALPTTRRYTWGAGGTVESRVACPLDSSFWRSGLLDRANEILAASPRVSRLVVDLEIYSGSRHHYDAGPCRCTH